jgi:hypothetical protein
LVLAIGCVAVLGWVTKPAAASPITFNVVFGSSGFDVPGGPVGLVLGDFDITLDPAVDALSTSGFVFHNLNISIADPIFSWTAAADVLLFGGIANGTGTAPGTNDFQLSIAGFTSGSPSILNFTYSQVGAPATYTASTGAIFVTPLGPAVATTPIPAALPLFLAALGGLGFAGWRRRKAMAA